MDSRCFEGRLANLKCLHPVAPAVVLRAASCQIPSHVCLRRLNWQLHFGEPPKWAADVKLVVIDTAALGKEEVARTTMAITCDAGAMAERLAKAAPGTLQPSRLAAWQRTIADSVSFQASPL